jgi:hypothetical protein
MLNPLCYGAAPGRSLKTLILWPLFSTLDSKMETLTRQQGGVYEILYYKKSGHGIWLQEDITPIRNEQRIIVLFLVIFRDITPFKEPLEGPTVMSNLSKFARLAWTITKSRQNLPQPSSTGTATSTPTAGGSTAAAGAIGSTTTANHVNSVNHRSQNALYNKKGRTPVHPNSSPSFQVNGTNSYFSGTSSLYRATGLTDSALPEYRHEPPKTPPHILLHYSNFKVHL